MTWQSETLIEMTCAEVEERLPLHALGLLDADEAAAVEAHLPLCPACQSVAVQFEAVAGAMPLALDPIAPDPAMRAQLMDRLDSGAPSAQVTKLPPTAMSPFRRLGLLAAAAVLLLAIGGGFWINRLIDERDEARTTAAMLQEFVSPNAVAMAMAPMAASEYDWGWGTSRLFKNPAGEMMLVVEGCPPTTEERRYPVWVAMGDDRTPLGDIAIGEDGSGWMMVTFPADIPAPEQLGVSMREGEAPLVDLFLGDMTG
ncbi:MAG: anti-sigma factor [Thermomicrobiales bacterium]|nr:anti-sigma factor [Thermomicrobiales bacterium]